MNRAGLITWHLCDNNPANQKQHQEKQHQWKNEKGTEPPYRMDGSPVIIICRAASSGSRSAPNVRSTSLHNKPMRKKRWTFALLYEGSASKRRLQLLTSTPPTKGAYQTGRKHVDEVNERKKPHLDPSTVTCLGLGEGDLWQLECRGDTCHGEVLRRLFPQDITQVRVTQEGPDKERKERSETYVRAISVK